ncbi:uncharacterized protein LOC122667757 [Telopea speciosissima]|uniref:uncharacterized protein LOC122667757 n=1 Tax=Telopea speciosissima TaxID=54955 RepID=UPI001CC65871|nr:uncharacterized protein LOC122667757 [Telopea speciosissima]
MAMRETVENQMSCPSITSSSRVAIFFIFVVCGALLCSSISSLLTFTVLILSTLLLFKVTKRKSITSTGDDLAREEVVSTTIYREVSEEVTHEKQQESMDISEEEEESREEDEVGQLQKNQNIVTGSHGLSSESERMDHSSSTSEGSEFDWAFPSEVRWGPAACSDDSISDDDSLIEIELPEGTYFGTKEEPITVKSRPNLPDFLPESMFPQEDLMGILAEINEMNEEENLIEIDISMGSIKCSRLEIEA